MLAHLADRALYRRFYDHDATPGAIGMPYPDDPRLRWALAHVQGADGVVDVGCHKGELSWLLREVCFGPYVGVDINQAALRYAGEVHDEPIAWVCAWAEELPFPADTFAAAVLTEVLEHVIDPAAVLAEAERVVRPGGRIVVSCPVGAEALERMNPDTRGRAPGCESLLAHVREFVPARELAGKAGLRLRNAAARGIGYYLASYEVV